MGRQSETITYTVLGLIVTLLGFLIALYGFIGCLAVLHDQAGSGLKILGLVFFAVFGAALFVLGIRLAVGGRGSRPTSERADQTPPATDDMD